MFLKNASPDTAQLGREAGGGVCDAELTGRREWVVRRCGRGAVWVGHECWHYRTALCAGRKPARESKLCCRESKLCFLSSRRTMASADFCFFTMPHLSHPQALFHTLPVTDVPFLSEREALQCLLIHPMPAPSRPGHLLTAGTGSPATPPRPHPP